MSEQKKGPSLKEDILKLIYKIVFILLLVFLFFTFIFGVARIENLSMEPNIKNGDLIVFYRLDKNYVATNVAVIKYKGKVSALRVVATGGDTVDIDQNGLIINGNHQTEPEAGKNTLAVKGGIDYPIRLKPGEVFLLGDNREDSVDSRMFGPVKEKDTLGELMTVIRRRNF